MLTRTEDHEPLSQGSELSFGGLANRSSDQVGKFISALHRQKGVVIASMAVCLGLGVLFLVQALPQYTATTSLLIDSKQVGFNAATQFDTAITFETGAVDSQVVLVQSDRIAGAVIDHLDLLHNEDFIHPPQSALSNSINGIFKSLNTALARFSADQKPRNFADYPVDIQRSLLVEQLQRNLKVSRNAHTYVLTISYSDHDPRLARSIAAAYGSAYLEDQLESRFDTARRAATWLDARIAEIKAKASAAGQAAQTFREKNDLTESSGRLINEQALTDANTQLSVARNDLASAKAKFDRLKQIVDSKDFGGSNIDALQSPIISQLRSKLLDAEKLDVDVSSRLGTQHEAAVKARKEMAQYGQLIFDELERMLQSYASEVQITTDRVASAEASVTSMSKTRGTNAAALAKAKTLDQEVTTYETLYANYLQKAQDLLQQQSLPITDARVIADASLPFLPSSPNKLLVLLASLALGGLVGGGVGALREYRERGFRTAADVRNAIGLDFVAYIPKLEKSAFVSKRRLPSSEDEESVRMRHMRPAHSSLTMVVDQSMSRYAESMRAIKLATDYHFGLRKPLVLGMISAFPNEGKSTVAKNLASLLALQGERVLLIDGDLRNPSLTRDLAPTARVGLLELLHGSEAAPERILHVEAKSGLRFLPGSARGRVPATGDALASPAMKELVQKLRQQFDFIVVDLPPLGAVLDAAAAGVFVDGYHMVVEWGRTPRSAIVDILATESVIASRIIGVSLTKVDTGKLPSYDTHSAYGYTGAYSSRYYHGR